MGLVIPWSFTLAILDGYSIVTKFPVHQSGIMQIIILGDSVLSILTLAAASSSASIVDILIKADVSFCPKKLCRNYQISAATAFSSWLLVLTSSLSNLWLLPSLDIDH
ncbi:integral membrane family protein [Striga asiatica]|uniref:CASP-like protein n=1 Tax=Striga asiatica TaxID=4170 RepID=A0A5A7QWX6_STRAF|nr:integral membrane family protein [Striga asiatica]